MKTLIHIQLFLLLWPSIAGTCFASNVLDYLNVEVRAEGKSSGVIAEIVIGNTTSEEISIFFGPYLAFVDDNYAPLYIEGFFLKLSGGGKKTFAATGYSLLNHKPVLPQGKIFREGVVLMGFDRTAYTSQIDSCHIATAAIEHTVDGYTIAHPGTGLPCQRVLNLAEDRQAFANLMIDAQMWMQKAYDLEHREGNVSTALSGDPVVQRDFILQLITWMYAGGLIGQPYTPTLFKEDLTIKFRKNTGGLSKSEETLFLQQVEREGSRFYETALMVGRRAGIFIDRDNKDSEVAISNSSATWCNIPGRSYPVFVDDIALCNHLNGTPIDRNASKSLYAEKVPWSFSSLQHQMEGLDALKISGRLNPFQFEGNLIWKTRNSPERIFQVNIDPQTNAFEFTVPFGEQKKINIDMVAREDGQEYTIFSSRFRMAEQSVTVKGGDRIPVEGTDMEVVLISPDAVYIKEGTFTHRLIPGITIVTRDRILALGNIEARQDIADIRIISKECCAPEALGGGKTAYDRYSALLNRPAGVSSRGYKGMILDPLIGFSPPEYVIGVIASFEHSPQTPCCGWLSAGSPEQFWGPYMSDLVHEALRSAVDSVIPETGSYRIVLMDPASRHYLAGLLQANSGKFVADHLPSAKLLNPDLIVDGRVSFACCNMSEEGACGQSSLKVSVSASLINAENGLILSSFDSEEKNYNQKVAELCYQPMDDSAPDMRREIGRMLSDKVAAKFIDRLTWKVQW